MCFKRRPRFWRMFLAKGQRGEGKTYFVSSNKDGPVHMTKKEIFNKYRLHIFVALILLIIVLFVSLGWYYKDRFQEENLAKQKVFVDPRQRLMTLSDGQDEVNVLLGQDLPQWQLPLHCSIQMEGNPNSKECEWKKNAILRVDYFLAQTQDGSSSAHCYNVSWETIRPPRVPHDCFDIGNAVWYGPSNQSAQTWPIQGSFSYSPKPSQLGNGGTFSSVADLYWLSSSGVGLLLNAENPLTLYWNNTRANYLCVVSNYTGPLYGMRQEDLLPRMNYTLCNGPNPKETHALMMPFLRGNGVLEAVPKDLFTDPHWSTKGGARKDVYNEDDVVSVVNNIRSNGLSCSVLALDGEWQTSQGDLVFDDNRFPNLTYMTELALNVCAIEIEVSPYFHYRSANFTEGVEKEFFVKDAGGEVPGLTRRKSGTAVAMLDVTKATSKSWFNTLVTKVFNRVKARAIRLSYGAEGWLPYKPNFNDPSVSLFKIRRMMAEMVSHQSDRFVLEHTSGSQNIAGLMTIPTDIKIKDGKSCLANAIERALTLGLLGYPYVMADGIRMSGTGQTVTTPSRDLFMRWMQMAAFFPAFTFSVPPWLYDDDTIALARNLSKLHSDLVVPTLFQTELAKEIAAGLPIMRPIWWLDPGNQTLHELRVSNQFLIGDGLLVAPVLCEGVTQRSVYIPAGVWDDRLRGNLVLGPRVIEAYRVEHYEVPYFVLMKTV